MPFTHVRLETHDSRRPILAHVAAGIAASSKSVVYRRDADEWLAISNATRCVSDTGSDHWRRLVLITVTATNSDDFDAHSESVHVVLFTSQHCHSICYMSSRDYP